MNGHGAAASRWVVPYPPRGSPLGPEELDVLRALASSPDRLCGGERRASFEAALREHTGAPHCLTLTSCTQALTVAVHLLDLEPGAHVVATPQTYQATIAPLLALDVEVEFCDVLPDSLNADPGSVASLLRPDTAAVVLVHHGGWIAEMDAIVGAAHAVGALVVDDCAHAMGATYRGHPPGALADLSCFSFDSYKNITTLGQGGMLALRRDDMAARAAAMREIEPDARFVPAAHPLPGRRPDPLVFWHEKNAYDEDCVEVRHGGLNGTLSEAACAVGEVQLRRLPELVARRRAIAAHLDDAVAATGALVPQRVPDHVGHARHLYTCFVDDPAVRRDDLVVALGRAGVEMQLRYFPLHLLPEWRLRGHGPGDCPVAEHTWFERQVQLPCYPMLTDAQVELLADAVRTAVAGLPSRRRAGT